MSLKNDLNEKFFAFVLGGGILAGLLTQSLGFGAFTFFVLLCISLATDVVR